MSKLLKTLAPVILAIFCSVCIVGSAWGDDFPVNVKAPENVETGKNIDIYLAFSRNEIENKGLNLKVIYSDGFISSTINAMITQESYQFTFKAPSQESTARISITISNSNTIISNKTIQVKVNRNQEVSVWLYPVLFVGAILAVGGFMGSTLAKLMSGNWSLSDK